MSIEAMKLALEALESCTPADTSTGHVVWPSYDEQAVAQAITALNTAIAEAEKQEPVAAQCKFDREVKWGWCEIAHHNLVQAETQNWPGYQTRLLYTTPPAAQRQWVGLTDAEGRKIAAECDEGQEDFEYTIAFFRAIEAKLKEKNT